MNDVKADGDIDADGDLTVGGNMNVAGAIQSGNPHWGELNGNSKIDVPFADADLTSLPDGTLQFNASTDSPFNRSVANNQPNPGIIYQGASNGVVDVDFFVRTQMATNPANISVEICKNNVLEGAWAYTHRVLNGSIGHLSGFARGISVAPNDIINLRVKNAAGTDTLEIYSYKLALSQR